MKKISYLLVFAAVVLIFSGCGKKSETGQSGDSNEGKSTGSQVVSSIKDAMSLGQQMECVYTAKIGNQDMESVVQIKGKNFKSTSDFESRKMYSLMKDETLYSWGEGIPTATKITLSCMKELEESAPKVGEEKQESGAQKFQNPETAFEDATKVSCKPIASADLDVPSDVQFQDMCEMMKGFSQGFPGQVNNGEIPGGAGIPNMPAAN